MKIGFRGVVALGLAFVVAGVGATLIQPAPSAAHSFRLSTERIAGQGRHASTDASLGRLTSFFDLSGAADLAAGDPQPSTIVAEQGSATPGQQPVSAAQPASPAAQPALAAPVLSRTFRVGIQAGHWLNSGLPDELAVLKGSTGAQGNGWREVDVNLDIARRVVALLSQAGVQVDLLPATVPVDYKADAFVALHGDASSSLSASGYKAARSDWSVIPGKDDALVKDISSQYQAATGLKYDPGTITTAMKRYYVFNNRTYLHTVDPSTPSVILEMGFLSSPKDRDLLVNHPDTAAQAIARGILDYLSTQR